MAHEPGCRCGACHVAGALPIEQGDRDLLADAWARWRSKDDGEVNKLRAGQSGAPGSTRWVALQAIASMRIAAEAIAADRRGSN